MEEEIFQLSQVYETLQTEFKSITNDLANSMWSTDIADLEDKYTVTDLIIPTEDYADYDVDKYIIDNAEFIQSVDEMTESQQKAALMAAPSINQLIVEAQANINHIKKHSLVAILKTSRCPIQSKRNYIDFDIDGNLKISLEETVNPIERNSLSQKALPVVQLSPQSDNFLFLNISIHSSVNQKKTSEMLIRGDSTIREFFESIACEIAPIDKVKYNRFLCLEKVLITEADPDKKSLNADFVTKRMKMFKQGFEMIALNDRMTLLDLEIVIDKVYIFRDNVGCDHMILFTDAFIGKLVETEDSSEKVASRYVPVYRTRLCEVCKQNKVMFIAKNADIDHKKFIFLCEHCNFDLNFSTTVVPKPKNMEIIDYVFEQK